LLDEVQHGDPKREYYGTPQSLDDNPTPRYDLLSKRFFVTRVVQATRGCPFSCSFWWQRKLVWFGDDNLTANRPYIKTLLRTMIPLKKWWLTQASMDIAKDEELLDLMEKSGCIGVFLGIETFGEESLKDANKRQNKVKHYKDCIDTLYRHGMAVMAGFIAGFDGDTPESIVAMADHLSEIGVDVPFLSVLTPYKGTPLYTTLVDENRLLDDRGWEFYNGYNVTFHPSTTTHEELLQAHRELWRKAFSLTRSLRRMTRSLGRLRPGAILLSLAMNSFYCFKKLRNNVPLDMRRWNIDTRTALEPVESFITSPRRPAQQAGVPQRRQAADSRCAASHTPPR
ncbi:MAG TPA: radical SAM protein, partial [Aggregatilineales bacterium]|nr:radical SAM protein [Aggregatilineales bacterium]